MKIRIIPVLAAVTALLSVSGTVNAATATMVAHNTRSSSGTLSTQKWATCSPLAATNPCISATNPWDVSNGVTGSTATWDWDGTTLTGTGTFWTTSHLSSNANGNAVVSDKVVNMVVNTTLNTTTATSYNCIDGNFLANVGANGCLNTSTGGDFTSNSSALYNVGGNANCVQRALGGDDASTGNPRGLASAAAAGGCDAVDGAFDFWTVVQNPPTSGGTLILSNGIDLALAGTNYLTFTVEAAAVPAPAAVWLLGTGVAALAGRRLRRRKAA